jgi:hypothetical protein
MFFFDSSSSTPNNSNGDNNCLHSAPVTSDKFGVEKFNYDYSMPYSYEENSEAATYGDGTDGGYGYGGMDFTPSEQQQQPYYESHLQGDIRGCRI